MDIIAELSSNHDGSIETAKALIDAAEWAGATHVKIQLFNPHDLWADRQLQQRGRLQRWPIEWIEELWRYSRDRGLLFGASIFHPDDLEETQYLDFLKLASSTVGYDELHRFVSDYRKDYLPLFVSVPGGESVAKVVGYHAERGAGFTLMACGTAYPLPYWDAGVRRIREWQKMYDNVTFGYSDHTRFPLTGAMAVAMGATVIEAHLKLDDSRLFTPDAVVSYTPQEFRLMVQLVHAAGDIMRLPYPAAGEVDRILQDPDGVRR